MNDGEGGIDWEMIGRGLGWKLTRWIDNFHTFILWIDNFHILYCGLITFIQAILNSLHIFADARRTGDIFSQHIEN